ncbi:hypothetical protein FA13DRAFT_1713471 [Coprinellus micaceus]|uniref:Uncharacterized protein n=1 Tax=Coprinellus micaceus TaxID=71717 RepID=A0A4Y7SWE5_COPMI|nr:hypothetical protein FA13DRAFT_1713471 [Coprinellus micaceus]
MAVQASCTAFTRTLRQPRCGCCGVLRYKPASTGPAIGKGVQAGTTDQFRVHRLLPTMLALWRLMLPASAASTIQAGRPRNGRPKSIGTTVALPGQGLHPSENQDADDDGGGGVTEQDSEAKELERRLDKTKQCLRWAPQVDLHAAARGDGSGEGREREAKFRVVEVGDIVGGTIPRVSTNLCRVSSILSSRECTCIPGGKERGEVVSEMVWGDVCGQSLERGASQIVGNGCRGTVVEERGRVEVDVEGSRAFGHPGLLGLPHTVKRMRQGSRGECYIHGAMPVTTQLERQDSTDTKIQHNDTYRYTTRPETAPAPRRYYTESEQNLNGRDPSFPQPNDLPPFQNNWWAPLASRTWMVRWAQPASSNPRTVRLNVDIEKDSHQDPVKARSEEPRDSVESLFDPLAGNLALLVVESPPHKLLARIQNELTFVKRDCRGRLTVRRENNKILLKTVQLSTSTVWGRGHRRPSEITANSGPSASRYRRGGVYAHKAASTTTWNHRTSRRTKTSRLTPEVDRKEETWAGACWGCWILHQLPFIHLARPFPTTVGRPGPPVDQENTGTVGGDFQWRLVFDAMYHKIVTPQQDLAISAITPQEHLATRQGSMVTRTGSRWMGALRLVRNRCIFTSAVLVALRFPGETHKTPRYVSPPLSCNAFTHRTFQQDGVVIAARTSKSISPEFQAGDLEAPGWLLGRYQGRGIKVDLWWPLASSCPSPHLEIVWVTEALRAYSLGFMSSSSSLSSLADGRLQPKCVPH